MLQVPAHHVLDFFCLKRKDMGVCVRQIEQTTCHLSLPWLKSLELRSIGRPWGNLLVTDLKPKVPWHDGAKKLLCSVTLLKGTQVAACLRSWGEEGEEKRRIWMAGGVWSEEPMYRKAFAGFLCFLHCSVVERNQVCAENNSNALLLWLWQLHNYIIFFCLLQLLLRDGVWGEL